MSDTLSHLEPKSLWKNFELLNEVPRPSKKEERVIAFAEEFGRSLQLETKTDKVGNVLIKKAATAGMESRKKIVLQSHLDMVHQKNNDTVFDFDKEGIKMLVEGDWIKAEGTTLGADNGIGVAAIMALLESTDIPHPAIEALFTIDEETGMTGAFGLEAGFLEGDILLNLDTEDDDELTIGCAGGINVSGRRNYEQVDRLEGFQSVKVNISGLSGGHSGMDIHKGLGNANKLMNRLLFLIREEMELQVHFIEGGGLRNAIPRESNAAFAVHQNEIDKCRAIAKSFENEIKAEYEVTDPNTSFSFEIIETEDKCASVEFSTKLINAIYAIPAGIYRMSSTVEGMVQTSNNLSQVRLKEGKMAILCLCRSSVDSEKYDEVRAIKSALSIVEADAVIDGDYPGWTPKPKSDIVDIMQSLYIKMFEGQPHVTACHAGLECGIIGSNYPDLDMVSFGPNIRGAHSPDEKVQISSVQKFWKFLLETLNRVPEK